MEPKITTTTTTTTTTATKSLRKGEKSVCWNYQTDFALLSTLPITAESEAAEPATTIQIGHCQRGVVPHKH